MEISVTMPVFNAEKYLAESIESILNQSFRDFEFLIIDDSSTDHSLDIINRYRDTDNRIKVLQNKYAKGIVGASNTGLEASQGKYIARMDADDVSLPDRFEKQHRFMESHPEVGICGTWANAFGQKTGLMKLPETDAEIRTALLFCCCMIHPTVMMRRDFLRAHQLSYREFFDTAQDYDLWARALDYTQFYNIPEMLLKYRVHETQISSARKADQEKERRKIKHYLLTRTGASPTADQTELHDSLEAGIYIPATLEDVEDVVEWIDMLGERRETSLRHPLFHRYTGRFIVKCYEKLANEGIKVLHSFSKNILFRDDVFLKEKVRFVRRWIRHSFFRSKRKR